MLMRGGACAAKLYLMGVRVDYIVSWRSHVAASDREPEGLVTSEEATGGPSRPRGERWKLM